MRNNKRLALIALLSGLMFSSASFAFLEGLPVASDGGLQVGSTKDPYWFNISGVLKVDERVYTGDTKTTASGVGTLGTYIGATFIRDLGITFEGGVGENFTYSIGLDIEANKKELEVDTAYVTYNGFRDLLPNLSFSVGQVAPGFCLTCAASSKWIPFMERSMGTNTFGPKQGLGISGNTYNKHYSATIAVTQQPKAGTTIKTVTGANNEKTHDLWQASGRFTYAPISEVGKVLQFGVSAHILEYANNGLQFRANPEMRSPNTTTLLNTTTYTSASTSSGQTLIAAKNQRTLDIEMLGIYGPWSGELEAQKAYVARGTVNGVKQGTGANLTFSGYHAQLSYILTGESRPLKYSNGTLGQIKPKSKYGAWEVSARYSFISLNSHDINGGRANNTTASLSWYANNNIKVIAEYVYSLERRYFSQTSTYKAYLDRRHVNGIGARVQLVF